MQRHIYGSEPKTTGYAAAGGQQQNNAQLMPAVGASARYIESEHSMYLAEDIQYL